MVAFITSRTSGQSPSPKRSPQPLQLSPLSERLSTTSGEGTSRSDSSSDVSSQFSSSPGGTLERQKSSPGGTLERQASSPGGTLERQASSGGTLERQLSTPGVTLERLRASEDSTDDHGNKAFSRVLKTVHFPRCPIYNKCARHFRVSAIYIR